MMVLFFWISCGGETLLPASGPRQDEESVSVDDSALDGEEEVLESSFSCMSGMVPVPEIEAQYCIMQCEAAFYEEQALSIQGVFPASNISFYRAKELCQNTPVSAGGYMRLPSYFEWLDAADGVYGEGGGGYPWGDSLHSGECVLPSSEVEWSAFQACGSLETCVSPYGVWDQLGNLWEWVDSGNNINVSQWFDARASEGRSLVIEDGFLKVLEGDLSSFIPFAVGFDFAGFERENGLVIAKSVQPFREDLPGEGYLMPHQIDGMASAEELLPIRLDWDEERVRAKIEVVLERDGEPIAAKVGGAFYSGAEVRLDTIFWGHIPDFDGTIGFRCVYDVE